MTYLANIRPNCPGSNLVHERLTDPKNFGDVNNLHLASTDEADGVFAQFEIGSETSMLQRSHWQKMLRVHTLSNSTQVMKLTARRNRSNLAFVNHSMCRFVFPVDVNAPVTSCTFSFGRKSTDPVVTRSEESAISFLPTIKFFPAFHFSVNVTGSKKRGFTTTAEAKARFHRVRKSTSEVYSVRKEN